MNPKFDITGEHDASHIVLSAMKKLASDIRENRNFDLYRIAQIIEFLRTYVDHCHHDKEELILFPTLVETDVPWVIDTIHLLIDEHIIARSYVKAMDTNLREYVKGHVYSIESLASNMVNYVTLAENHMKIENQALLPLIDRFFNRTKLESISLDFRHIQKREICQNKHLEFYILLRKLYSETAVRRESEYAN
jgi:hemerythrin-like domain-containing protein